MKMIHKTLLTVSTAIAAMAVLNISMVSTADASMLINTYTNEPGNPANGPYLSNITTDESNRLNGDDHASRKLVDGISTKDPEETSPPQTGLNGFFDGPNFTDTDSDGFPDHGTHANAMWLAPVGGVPLNETWVSFSLPSTEQITFMRVWNQNQAGTGPTAGVEDAFIWYSNAAGLPTIEGTNTGGGSPGAGWTMLGTGVFTLAQADGLDTYDGETIDLNVTAKHILIDIETNHGNSNLVGFSEFQFFMPDEVIVEYISIVTATAGVSFDTLSNATYRLQSTPDLVSSNFSDTGAFTIGNGSSMTLFDPTGPSTSKNYRVVLLVQ